MKTLSSREFNQQVSKAKQASLDGPVFITDRGKPAHVLLSIEQFHKLTGQQKNIIGLLNMPGVEDIDIEFPKLTDITKPIDLS